VGDVRLAGRYLLQERIGRGGMGEVWRATDEVLGRTVAVKLVLPELLNDAGFVRRFLAEARAMASVDHAGVIAIHDFHGDAQGAYLVMEFVEGEPLSRLLARHGRLGAGHAMDLVAQAGRALQAVHDRGIVPRDVKPANLLVRPNGALALGDFGIAHGADETALTGPNLILGTPSYLAPEQVLGQPASPRSDVYALGLVAYECLTGRRPFVGDSPFAVATARVGQYPPPLDPDVAPAVAAVVARALEPDPSRRWPSAAAFADAAARATFGELSSGGGAGTAQRPARSVPAATRTAWLGGSEGRPGRHLVAGLVGVALAVAAGVTYLIWSRPPAPDGGGPRAGGASSAAVPAGFVQCGETMCPAGPLCWNGLTVVSDQAMVPGTQECNRPHYWETFAAVALPADATSDRDLSTLIERDDIAALCSPERMAERSLDPAQTAGWRIEAWPIPADPFTVLVHCLAGSPEGETPGAAFG
jgi:serine/threonine-protein kinase